MNPRIIVKLILASKIKQNNDEVETTKLNMFQTNWKSDKSPEQVSNH